MRTFLIFLSFIIAIPLFSQTTIHVPFDYPTIQGGLNAASAADTVMVAPGIYYENIIVGAKYLIGAEGRENTIIDGNGIGNVLSFSGNSFVKGFTIQNGDIGVKFYDTAPSTITDVVIINNKVGIESRLTWDDGGNLTVNNSIIANNGRGIYLGGFHNTYVNIYLTNVIIVGNEAYSGGGIYLAGLSNATLSNVVISDNSTEGVGGGIFLSSTSTLPNPTNVVISRNNAGSQGGGIYSASNLSSIKSITFCNNFAPEGAGIYRTQSTIDTVSACNFVNNNNAIYHNSTSTFVDARNNYFGHNSGPYHSSQNPTGLGDSVNLYVRISPWLTEPNIDAPPIPALNVNVVSTTTNSITLSWDASKMSDITGYKVHYSPDLTSYEFPNTIDVGLDTTYILSSLVSGSKYYFSVTTYDIDGNESWYSKTVSGQTTSYPIISVSDDNLDFGEVTIGNEKQLNLIIKNIGTEGLNIFSITTNSSNEFHTVFGFPIKISPGDSVVQSIYFEPSGSGTFYDTLLIHSNANNKEFHNVALEGKGIYGAGPSISVSTDMVDFGQTTVGYEKEYLLGIKNIGEQTLTIFNAQAGSNEFYTKLMIELNILPNDSTELPIYFKPNELGNYSDTLTINSNAIQEPQLKIPLEGVGAYPIAPVILGIQDIPNDQGGFVRIEFQRSRHEGVEGDSSIQTYSFWRKIPSSDEWDAVGLFNVIQQPIYYYVAPTLGDSTKDGIFWSTFKVSAHPANPLIFFMSEPDSGYSIDNIAPDVPTGLLAAQLDLIHAVLLDWDEHTENDFSYYAVYKGSDESFEPDSTNLLGTTTDTSFVDSDILSGAYYYKVSAFDYSGNESEFASTSIVVVGLDDVNSMPTEYSLEQNYPNPFNPSTIIKYGLPENSNVKIEIFNMIGQRYSMLVNTEKSAGFYETTWDASNLPSGIYLIRIEAVGLNSKKNFTQVKKALLLK